MPRVAQATVDDIVRHLSKSQRDAILWLADVCGKRQIWIETTRQCSATTAAALSGKGLVYYETKRVYGRVVRRTKIKPLGRLVIKQLRGKQ